MATTIDDLKVRVTVEAGGASKTVEKLGKEIVGLGEAADDTGKGMGKMSTGVDRAASSVITLNQGTELAKKILDGLNLTVGRSIEEFEKADAVQVRLKASMAANGKFTRQALADWEKYAKQVEASSTVDDDHVLSLVAKSQALGRNDKATKELIGTANDLAAVFDGDVDQAFDALAGTLNGIMPRGITKLDGRLRDLTETQLKNGVAIEILGAKYKGFAALLVDSVEGAKAQSANALNNLLEEVGKRIDDIFDFKQLYKDSRDFFNGLKEFVVGLQPAARELGVYLKAIGEAVAQIDFRYLAENSQILIGVLGTMAAINLAPFVASVGIAAAEFIAMAVAIGTVVAAIDIVFRNMDKLPQVAALFEDAFMVAFSNITKGLLELIRFMLMQVQGLALKVGAAFPETELAHKMALLAETVGGAFDTMTEEIETQSKQSEYFLKRLQEDAEGLDLGLAGALKNQLDNLIKNFKKAYADIKAKGPRSEAEPQNRPQTSGGGAKLPELFTAQDTQLIGQMFGTGAGSFAGAASTMAAVPLGMLQAANIILDAILKLLDIIPEILNKIGDVFEKLLTLPNKIVDAFGHIFDAFLNLTRNIFKNLFEQLGRFNDMLIEFAEALPDAIMESFKELPDMLLKFINRIPDVFERVAYEIGEAMPEIAFVFVKSIIGNMPKIIAAYLTMIPRLVFGIVRGVLTGLRDGFKNIFGKGVKVDTSGVDDIKKTMKKIVDTATNVGDQVFKVIDIGAANKAKSLGDDIRDSLSSSMEKVKSEWQKIIDALLAAWRWIYNTILLPIITMFHEIAEFFGKIWTDVILPIVNKMVDGLQAVWEFVKTLVDKIVDGLQALWEGVIKPIVDKMVDGLQAVWDLVKTFWEEIVRPIVDKMVDGFKAVWEGAKTLVDKLVDGLKAVWTDTIKPIVDKLSSAGSNIWNGLKDALDKSGETLKGYGAKFWDGLKDKFDKNVDVLKGLGSSMWDGLKAKLDKAGDTFKAFGTNIWDSLKTGLGNMSTTIKEQLDKVNPSNLFKKMFNFDDTSGTGKVEKVLGINVPYVNFAQGGAVTAGDSILNDKILAMLSPGEAVIPRSLMQNPDVRRVVDEILGGKRHVGGFAYGAKDLKKDLGGGGGGGGGGIGGVFGDLAKAGQTGFEGLGDIGSEAAGYLGDFLGGLDPSKLWDKVLDKVGEGVMNMFASNAFAEGGIVGGGSTSRPAPMMMPTPAPSQSGGSVSYQVSMNIYPQGQVDGAKIYREFKDALMRDSRDGKKIIDKRGVI